MVDVFGWQADQSACGYYRIQLPLTAVREHGITAGYGMRYPRDRPPKILIGQRLGRPQSLDLIKQIKRQGGTTVVYEIDDDLFNVPRSNPASGLFSQPEVRKYMAECMRAADYITVSTPEMSRRVLEIAPGIPIEILPNSLPEVAFGTPDRSGRPITIGWRGSATHEEDFAECRHGLGQILTRYPGVHFKVVGQNPTKKLPEDRLHVTGWIRDMPTYYEALDFDIGLVPLADNTFNQSKSEIAVLEMAARGIPVIASDVPAYRRFIDHGENGFLVKQNHEWAKYMRVLLESPELRMEMGENGFKRAHDFKTSVVSLRYRTLFQSMLEVSS